jgi:hypothetical protein
VLTTAVVAAFVLVGGYMIGSATAYNNNADHQRQIECIEHGGHYEYVNNVGTVCKK